MNGNKRINNLKKLVVLISIAILVVAVVLIMSIYNNKFGKVGGPSEGGMSTVSTTKFTDIIIDPDTGEEITTTATTEETTTAATQAPSTDTPTTTSTTKTTKVVTKTQKPTSGSVAVTNPPSKYTIITSGGSGFANANSSLEWALVNEINGRRSSKLQVASELRAQAEQAASRAASSYDSTVERPRCDFGDVKFDGAAYCTYENKAIAVVANTMINTNGGLLDSNYSYIGVGTIVINGNYIYVVVVD